MPADERLQRLLGGAALAGLRLRLRQRYERAGADAVLPVFRIERLTPREHAALAALQGRPARFASSMAVDAAAIDANLRRADVADSLRAALEALDGRIVDRAAEREAKRARWGEVRGACRHPALASFLDTPAGGGLLKRLTAQDAAAAMRCVAAAEAVLERLPAHGVTRAQLAADALGDAHALDVGRVVATLVLAVLRFAGCGSGAAGDAGAAVAAVAASREAGGSVAAGNPPAAGDLVAAGKPPAGGDPQTADNPREPEDRPEPADPPEADSPRSADSIPAAAEPDALTDRDLWANAGVLVNELARPALILNLPVAEADGAPWRRGEPAYLSLRFLLRTPPVWAVQCRAVYVCENPNLLAIAADRLGATCAPLVCIEGMPSAAQHAVLTQLAAAGARLLYHGDFDWAGVRIGNHVMREHDVRSWRFGAQDYSDALAAAPRPGRALQGSGVEASWDAALGAAMRAANLAIDEEMVAEALLRDLGTWR